MADNKKYLHIDDIKMTNEKSIEQKKEQIDKCINIIQKAINFAIQRDEECILMEIPFFFELFIHFDTLDEIATELRNHFTKQKFYVKTPQDTNKIYISWRIVSKSTQKKKITIKRRRKK